MADYNLVVLAGRLTRDPELTYTENDGTPFTKFTLAVNRVSTDADGSYKKSVAHVDVAVWKHQAELCCQFTKKGSRILVSGSLELLRWTDKDGTKRSKLRVRAQRIQFLDKGAAPSESPAAEDVAS
jgi:single-strand DNA-binding protein